MKNKVLFEIMEYDRETRKYKSLAWVPATSREDARAVFLKENNWKAREGTLLFVPSPICR